MKPNPDATAQHILNSKYMEVMSRLSDADAEIITASTNEFARRRVKEKESKLLITLLLGLFLAGLMGTAMGGITYKYRRSQLEEGYAFDYQVKYQELVATFENPAPCLKEEPEMSWAHTATVDQIKVYQAETEDYICISYASMISCIPQLPQTEEVLAPLLNLPEPK